MSSPSTPPPTRRSLGQRSQTAVGFVSGRLNQWLGKSASLPLTARKLLQQIWIWPLLAAVVIGGCGWWVHTSVENALRQQRVVDLTSVVDATASALRNWYVSQAQVLKLLSEDAQLQERLPLLLQSASEAESATPPPAAVQSLLAADQEAVRRLLTPLLRICDYRGYWLVAPNGTVIAADQKPAVGQALYGYALQIVQQALRGDVVVSRPFENPLPAIGPGGELLAHQPLLLAAAPVRAANGQVCGVIAFQSPPERGFSRNLNTARAGRTGEVYAFDSQGLLLSQSLFDDQLKQIGLLPDVPQSRSILHVELRDPQVDLTSGARPPLRRSEQPLTEMAREAIDGQDGVNADGYRDYRGVPVVGAWRWLPEYNLGIAAEIDAAEVFAPVAVARRAYWMLMTLLAFCALLVHVAMLYMARQQRALQQATLAARQLGQYALEERIGSGGMGTVYRARHAMLRRPTAIKLLDVDRLSDVAIARFEREVQLTSTLSHPNTVSIFDYGRTPEGVFYYAMEYLEGINLDDFVRRFGPLGEGRVVHLLKQVCGALAEAHGKGLIHRDIKPANVFLTIRGGVHDFVKVLDFGLVKSVAGADSADVSSPHAVTGTPLFLSPEAIQSPDLVDTRADVYAIGALGYYLLTGTPVFNGGSVVEICLQHVQAAPESISLRVGRSICPDLEALLLRCLSKTPSVRPADAAELLRDLEVCDIPHPWSERDAASWWKVFGRILNSAAPEGSAQAATADASTEDAASTMIFDARQVRRSAAELLRNVLHRDVSMRSSELHPGETFSPPQDEQAPCEIAVRD